MGKQIRKWLKLLMLSAILPLMLAIISFSDSFNLRTASRDMSLDIYTNIAPYEGDLELAKQMVFVNIDEASLATFGQWPWPRQYMAILLQNIGVQEPAAIGFDVLFSEQDRFNANAIEALGGLEDGSLK